MLPVASSTDAPNWTDGNFLLLTPASSFASSFFCEASCWWLDKEIRGSEEVHPCKSNNSWADSMLSGKGCYISVCS